MMVNERLRNKKIIHLCDLLSPNITIILAAKRHIITDNT